jgi:hypothetical protein
MHSAFSVPRKHQLVMLIMLLCAWLPISSMVSFLHASTLTQQIEEQHHKQGSDDTQHAAQEKHDHSDFDHDHQPPQILLEKPVEVPPPQPVAWLQQAHASAYSVPSHRLERPPRLV